MAASERPGGLTALAAISILYGVIALFAPVELFKMKNSEYAEGSVQDPEMEVTLQDHQELSDGVLWTLTSVAVLQGLLYIVSATGFLKLKRFRGLILGNLAALLGVGAVFLSMQLLPDTIDQGRFNFSSIVSLLYPVACLGLLNLVFREDLVK